MTGASIPRKSRLANLVGSHAEWMCGSIKGDPLEKSRHPPTVSGFAVTCALAALGERRIAAAPLLSAAGLSQNDVIEPTHRIAAAAQARFLEVAAEAVGDDAFGLHLAEQANPRAAGLLFYALSAAANLGEALDLFARYARIVNEAALVKIVRAPDGVRVEANFAGIPRRQCRQNIEFGLAIMFKALREISGRRIRPIETFFSHPRSTRRAEFERFFGCDVHFLSDDVAAQDGFLLADETLALPLVTEDRHLLETLKPFCDAAARKRRTATETFRAAVENEAQKLLPHGKARAATVAKALHVSVRTFARRLADEGTSYAEVVDELRRSLALQYLKEPGFSVAHVAWLVGYERASSFNHAFKRWTGRPPSAAKRSGVEQSE